MQKGIAAGLRAVCSLGTQHHKQRPALHPPKRRQAPVPNRLTSAVYESDAAAPATLSGDSHTMYRLPQGWKQVLAVQVGVGCDLHGQSSTKAAVRACRHAIEFVDLPCVHDIVPGRYEGIRLKVKVACPNSGRVDLSELKQCFPYGHLEIEAVEGGMRTSSCNVVPELGEAQDEMFVAVAAVTVGF